MAYCDGRLNERITPSSRIRRSREKYDLFTFPAPAELLNVLLNPLVDCFQRLVPASHRSDDLIGIGAPDKRSGLLVMLLDEAVDGGLQVAQARA